MQAQLYRFRIETEVARGVLTAIDEADQSRVWLVAVEPARQSLQSQRPQLDRLALERKCEYFTAGSRLYLVAASSAQSQELRAAVNALGLGPVEPVAPPVETPVVPVSSRAVLWTIGSIIAVIAAIVIIVALWPNSPAAAPEFAMSGTSLTIRDSTPGAVIHFTVDGRTPTESSARYDQPLTGLHDGAVLQAIAIAPDHAPSPANQFTYTTPEWFSAYKKGEAYLKAGRFQQARSSLASACRGASLDACNDLARLYYYGQGGPGDEGKARAILGSACDRGGFSSCASLGRIYQVDRNFPEAARYYQKACAGGFQVACNQLRQAR